MISVASVVLKAIASVHQSFCRLIDPRLSHEYVREAAAEREMGGVIDV